MSFEDVLKRSTINPARVINRMEGMGTLAVGSPADIALLELAKGQFQLVDSQRNGRTAKEKLVSRLTICRGKRLIASELVEKPEEPLANTRGSESRPRVSKQLLSRDREGAVARSSFSNKLLERAEPHCTTPGPLPASLSLLMFGRSAKARLAMNQGLQ